MGREMKGAQDVWACTHLGQKGHWVGVGEEEKQILHRAQDAKTKQKKKKVQVILLNLKSTSEVQ